MLNTTITPNALKVGDILLTRDKTHDFFRHISIVIEADSHHNRYQVAHYRGIGDINCLTVNPLVPQEVLDKLNIEYHVFRLQDQQQAQKAITIISNWVRWAVPFDRKGLIQYGLSLEPKYYDMIPHLFNSPPPPQTHTSYSQEQVNKSNLEFKQYYMDVAKYAVRREICPRRPKLPIADTRGFNCLQGMLLAFQISYIEKFVQSKPNQWLANKHTERFESVQIALSSDFKHNTFITAIPPAFQLWAKKCAVDTFRYALEQDTNHIDSLGLLKVHSQCDLSKEQTQENKDQLNAFQSRLKQSGIANRQRLLEEVIIPSLKCQPREIDGLGANKIKRKTADMLAQAEARQYLANFNSLQKRTHSVGVKISNTSTQVTKTLN